MCSSVINITIGITGLDRGIVAIPRLSDIRRIEKVGGKEQGWLITTFNPSKTRYLSLNTEYNVWYVILKKEKKIGRE